RFCAHQGCAPTFRRGSPRQKRCDDCGSYRVRRKNNRYSRLPHWQRKRALGWAQGYEVRLRHLSRFHPRCSTARSRQSRGSDASDRVRDSYLVVSYKKANHLHCTHSYPQTFFLLDCRYPKSSPGVGVEEHLNTIKVIHVGVSRNESKDRCNAMLFQVADGVHGIFLLVEVPGNTTLLGS